MNKKEIQKQIEEVRKRHSAELKALEAKLNEPEKWEPKGGVYYVGSNCGDFLGVLQSDDVTPLNCKTEKEGKDLASHLKRQAILWQLANDLNDGWEPDFGDSYHGGKEIFYNYSSREWQHNGCGGVSMPYVIFKDSGKAAKACEILNNQPELMR